MPDKNQYPQSGRPLYEGLPDYETVSPDAMFAWAEVLADIVNRRLYPSGETELTIPSNDELFNVAFGAVMQQMIAARVKDLTPEQFAEVYRRASGDESLTEYLDELYELRSQQLAHQTILAKIRQEAIVSGRLRLGALPPETVITIGLFDPSRPDMASKHYIDNTQVRPLHRVLQLRLLTPQEGDIEIIYDNWVAANWSDKEAAQTTLVPPLTRVKIGTTIDNMPDQAIEPILKLNAPLTLAATDYPIAVSPQIVGYIETLSGEILLDGTAGKA